MDPNGTESYVAPMGGNRPGGKCGSVRGAARKDSFLKMVLFQPAICRALEMTGNLLLELGEVEKAQQCLGR